MKTEAKNKAIVAGLGLAAFFASVPISKKLKRSFPDHPFVSQILVGGSLIVLIYSIGKALHPKAKSPDMMLSKAWGVFGETYSSMSAD